MWLKDVKKKYPAYLVKRLSITSYHYMGNTRLVKTFIDLAEIDSPSGKEEKVSLYIEQWFNKHSVLYKKDSYGNLIATIRGAGKPLLLSAHMDTVDPCRGIKAAIKNDTIVSSGNTILGADDKAGIAEILEAMLVMKEKKVSHRPLKIVFTREEETGVYGAMALSDKDIIVTDGLGLDGTEGLGVITLASPHYHIMDIIITGQGAHAGSAQKKGINALSVAVDAISNLSIGIIDRETSTNIGVLQSGYARNGVPESALIKAEVRSHVNEKAKKQVSLFKDTFQAAVKKYGATLDFTVSRVCVGYKYSKKDPHIKKVINALKKVGVTPTFNKSMGGSDVNAFVGKGIRAVDISYGAYNFHTTKEKASIPEMEKMVAFLIEYCRA